MKSKFFLIVVLFALGCSEKTVRSPQSWHSAMHGLGNSFSEILPLVIAKKNTLSPKERKKINLAIEKLKNYSVEAKTSKRIPSNDPIMKYIASDFFHEISRIQKGSELGNFNDAKTSLRGLSKYCIACHTASRSGSSFGKISTKMNFDAFSNFEKATYFTTVKQFEKALVQYEYSLVDKKWAKSNNKDWNDGVKNLLAITVRVKSDPDLTLEMISRLFDKNAYDSNLKTTARIWQSHAKQWQNEAQVKPSLNRVRKFLDLAFKENKKLVNSGLILNLRASSELNEILKKGVYPTPQDKQRAFFLAGQVSQRMAKFNFGEFPSAYFRACVDVNSKSVIGQKCSSELK